MRTMKSIICGRGLFRGNNGRSVPAAREAEKMIKRHGKLLKQACVFACAVFMTAGFLQGKAGCAAETQVNEKGSSDIQEYILQDNQSAEEEKTDYTEIFRQACPKLQEEDIGHISVLIWEMGLGMDNTWMAVDYEKKAVYGGIGGELDNSRETHLLKELTEEDLAFIGETIRTAGITGWDNFSISSGEWSDDGNETWRIGIRLDSGKCIKYEKTGFVEYGMPENPGVTFCMTLWNRFALSGQ